VVAHLDQVGARGPRKLDKPGAFAETLTPFTGR